MLVPDGRRGWEGRWSWFSRWRMFFRCRGERRAQASRSVPGGMGPDVGAVAVGLSWDLALAGVVGVGWVAGRGAGGGGGVEVGWGSLGEVPSVVAILEYGGSLGEVSSGLAELE